MFNVLYVDDEQALLDITKIFLETTGEFSVWIQTSAQVALDSPQIHSCDAIVSDYQMSDMDGIEFLKAVRKQHGDVPFILFTGRGREEVVIQAINNGADFYLQKGGDPSAQFAELAHKIRKAIERHHTVEALKDSEQRLSDIINFLPDATFAINRSGHVIAWNHAIEEMTGVFAAEMLGKGEYEYALPFYTARRPMLIDLVFSPDDVIAKDYSHITHQKDILVAESTLPRPLGRTVTITAKASPLYNRQGEIVGAIESIRDITDIKKAEEEIRAANEQLAASAEELRAQYDQLAQTGQQIRESEIRFRELAELLPQIVFEMDRNFQITFANQHAYTALGYSPDEVTAGFSALAVIDPSQHHSIAENIARLARKESHEHFEYTFVRKDGSTFPALVYADPVYRGGDLTGFRGVVVDITERKKAEEALRDREASLSSIFRAAPVGIGLVSNRILLRVNDRLCAMTGYSAEELVGKSARIVYPTDDEFDYVGREKYEQIRQHGTGTVETRWQKKDGTIRNILLSSTPLDPKNLAAGVTFTALDITEEKRAHDKLQTAYEQLIATEEELRKQYDELAKSQQQQREGAQFIGEVIRGVREGIIVYDRELRIALWNPFMEEMTGLPAADVLGKNALDLFPFHKETGVANLLRQALAGSIGESDDFRFFIESTGRNGWAKGLYSPHRDAADNIIGVIGVVRDITKRKRAEDALRGANQVVENSPVVVFRWKAIEGWPVAYVSQNVIRFGYSPDELLSGAVSYSAIIHPDDLERVSQEVKKYSSEGTDQYRQEYRLVTKNGSVRWVDDRTVIERDADGNITHYQGIVIDITDSKRAQDELQAAYEQLTRTEEELRRQYEELAQSEERIRESEVKFRAIIDHTFEFIGLMTPDGILIEANKSALAFAGLSESGVLNRPFWETPWWTHSPELQQELKEAVKKAAAGEMVRFEATHTAADGHLAYIDFSIKPVLDTAGRILYLIPEGRDITDRKHAEEALRASEKKYREIFENTTVAVFQTHIDGSITTANPAFARLLGYDSSEEVIREVSDIRKLYVYPDLRDELYRILRRQDAVENFELALYRRDRSILWASVNVRAVRGENGSITGLEGLAVDITERKKAEADLRESEARYRLLVNNTEFPVVVTGIDSGNALFINESASRFFGVPAEELTKLQAREFWVNPADRDRFVSDLLSKGKLVNYETLLKTKAGDVRWTLINATAVDFAGERAAYIIYNDITDRKRAEEALRESEERYRELVEISPDAILLHQDGRILYMNPAGLDLIGATDLSEVVNKNVLELIHPGFRNAVRINIESDLKGEISPSIELQMCRLDGKLITVEGRGVKTLFKGRDAVQVAIRDITERRSMENAIREASRKLNLLNSITRHDVVNQLTVLQGYIQIAAMKKPDPVTADFLVKIEAAAKKIGRQIEFTRTYQELGIKVPAWFRIDEVVSKAGPFPVRFSGTCKATEIFADPMFEQVFFNLFDNAVRHGERMTEIIVRCEREPDGLLVIVEDNGIGIPLPEKEKIFLRGYGKHTGLGLFLAREILAITGITIKETGKEGKGARFEIFIPKGAYRFGSG